MTKETLSANNSETGQKSYRELIKDKLLVPGIENYFHYDEKGHLWVGDLRIVDAVALYGTPLKIFDMTVVETRCQQWQELTEKAAKKVGYQGGFEYFYATKANPMVELLETVIQSGWGIETSSAQDLDNLHWLVRNGRVDVKKIKVICNGFKLPPQYLGNPSVPETVRSKVIFDTDPRTIDYTEQHSYAEYICLLRLLGVNIEPMLDSGEINFFGQRNEIPEMEVGLRMKFGQVKNDSELEKLVSRHGMSWEKIQQNAQRIDKIPHLHLTTLHAMVGAAEIIPVETFIDCLTFAAEKYFILKRNHPELTGLDIGGGIPPMSSNYDYEKLLTLFLSKVKKLAEKEGSTEPKIIFELGSFVASEAAMNVVKVIQFKINGADKWAIINSGLMADIPDILMIKKKFDVIAANNANNPAEEVIIGDITCDHDGRYPTIEMGGKVLIPHTDLGNNWPLIIVFNDTGAYQDALSGEGGAHHCLLPEEGSLFIRRKNGKVHTNFIARQTSSELRQLLGYSNST